MKKYTFKELDDMRCEIWSRQMQALDDNMDVVEFVEKILELRTEVLETPDKEIIKEYNKLLN